MPRAVLLEKAVQAPIVQQKGVGTAVRQIKQQRIPGFVFVAEFRHPVKNFLRNLLRMGAGKRAGQDYEQNQRGERSFHHKNPLVPFFHRTNGLGISFRASKQKRPASKEAGQIMFAGVQPRSSCSMSLLRA